MFIRNHQTRTLFLAIFFFFATVGFAAEVVLEKGLVSGISGSKFGFSRISKSLEGFFKERLGL